MRLKLSRKILALAAGGALVLVPACAGDGDDGGGGGDGGDDTAAADEPLVVGTTDEFTTIDPAGTYDLPGWGLLYNIGETLLSIPPGGSEVEPDLAEKCDYTAPTTYECTLRDGAQWSDGSPLTSADVKHTFDRMLAINDPQGPASLYVDSLESVDTPDDTTVVFNLKFEDATWPARLTTGGATIVPSSFPADALQDNEPEKLVFSGPYKLSEFDPTQQIVLEPNENYTGNRQLSNAGVLIQPMESENLLRTAVEQGDVHVAYRSMNPTILGDLEENGAENGVQVVNGDGSEIMYVAFHNKRAPFDKKEVRQAVAALLDRQVIASEVYNDTRSPLYSMVPDAYAGHVPVFKEVFGEKPDPDRARQLLEDAGVEIPVKATLWYQSERYGEASADMFNEIKRQLEDSGLFEIALDTTGWEQYQLDYDDGAYDAYQLGWFPDFPDADNYLSPFYSTNNFISKTGYGFSNPTADELLQEELSTVESADRMPIFGELQQLGADEVPLIPLIQADQVAAVREGVTGVEDTFDASTIFRYWLVSPPTE